MMLIDFILIIFFILAALLVWYSSARGGFTSTSLIGSLLVIFLAITSFWSIREYRGYPVQEIFVDQKEIHAAIIEDPRGKFKGRIYLWTRKSINNETLLEKVFKLKMKEQPRGYEIPYTKETAKKLREGMEKAKKGMKLKIKAKKVAREAGNDFQKGRFVIELENPRKGLEKN